MARMQPDFCHEAAIGGRVAGVDEAGRGPWAGPVVAAAVILDPSRIPDGIADSKALSAAQRAATAQAIREGALCFATGVASVEEIDRLNILQATFLAMRRAVEGLSLAPSHVLIDGNRAPALALPATAIVKGDQKSLSVAAASIIAKTVRDRMMCDLAHANPQYGWERNKGYGTDAHAKAIAAHGLTREHRVSFKPINQILCAGQRETQQIPR